ncbi:MAG TPA: site-specific integrase [Acidiferrobacteraceae bacterium]|nr:site-specific integrase [Acidiferrobacteraceae bacterium]
MATFRKRGPYQWQAQVRKKGQPLQTKTFETRALAAQWAHTIEVEMDKGMFVSRAEAESTTLKELLERYLVEVTPLKKGAEPETNRLRAFMRHPLARRFVAGIRGIDMARFRDERLQKVSPSTVKRDLVLLGHVFEVARKEWGIHFHNPVRDIKLPADGRPRNRRLQDGEETRLLAACREARNHHLLPIVQLALETAMRQGELIRLRWEHIDLNRRTAHLPDTKNGEARTVPLSTIGIRVLRALHRSLHGQAFPGVTTEAIKRAYIRAVRRAGIEDLRFHNLRHEATTRLFEKGLNIMEVASITGHKDLRMLRRYTHLKAEDLAKKLG